MWVGRTIEKPKARGMTLIGFLPSLAGGEGRGEEHGLYVL